MARKPKDTDADPATTNAPKYPPLVLEALGGLAAARKTSKDRVDTLQKRRKELDEELNQLGEGVTTDHLETSRKMVVTLRSLKWHRARVQSMADSIEELLLQPEPLSVARMPNWTRNDPDEAQLFHAAGEESDSDDDEDEDLGGERRPVGEAGGPSLEYDSPAGAAGAPAEADLGETIDAYLPGRWRDQNGADVDLGDFAAVQEMALNAAGADAGILPTISPAYGARIDITRGDGSKCITLTYAGPIPEKPKRGRKGAGK